MLPSLTAKLILVMDLHAFFLSKVKLLRDISADSLMKRGVNASRQTNHCSEC